MESKEFTEDSIMPFGAHYGKKMKYVPAAYLLFLHNNGKINDSNVRDYVAKNLDKLKDGVGKQLKSNNKNK